jgi:arginine:pyruvate transaminase
MRYASITERLAGLGSGKWAIHIEARKKAAEGIPVIQLTIGEPDLPPDPTLLAECTRALHAGRTRYSNGRGEASVVSALVEKYRKRRDNITERNVLCFPGTQSALFVVLMGLLDAGDEVLVGDPYYATYEGLIASSGARLSPVKLKMENGFHLNARDLEAAITSRSRVLLMNTPHNPTGAVLTSDEISAIGEVCRRHDLWIVCDEVYEELAFGQNLSKTFASPFDNPALAERTVVVSSISKSHAAPGFRSGWAVGPSDFCDRLLPVSETMLFGMQPFIADMTAMALTQPIETSGIMRTNYERRARLIATRLKSISTLKPIMPEGGMFIVVDVGATGLTGYEFAARLLEEQHVAVMPGSSFGEAARNLIRVSLTVSDDMLAEAADRMIQIANMLAAEAA